MKNDILDYLEEIGVLLEVKTWGQIKYISANTARMFAEKKFNSDQVQAYLEDVSLEVYRKWFEWNAQGQPCQALTKKDRRCRNHLRYPRVLGPSDFENGGFCDLHWEKFNE